MNDWLIPIGLGVFLGLAGIVAGGIGSWLRDRDRLRRMSEVIVPVVRVSEPLGPPPTITSILLDCTYPRRFFVVPGDEVDDPTNFKWFEDYDRALEVARMMYDFWDGRKRVRIYDVDTGQYLYDVGQDLS